MPDRAAAAPAARPAFPGAAGATGQGGRWPAGRPAGRLPGPAPGPGGSRLRRGRGGQEPGQRGTGGRQVRIGVQDAGLQVAQFPARFHAELVHQHPPGPLVGGQRLGLPAAPVERQHQLGVEPLAPRMVAGQLGQLTDQFRVQSPGQPGVHPPFLGLHPQRVQPRYLGGDEHVGGHIHERVPAPQADGLAQELPRPRVAAGGRLAADGLAALAAQRGEAQRVHLVRVGLEGVTRIAGDDPPPGDRAEDLPQALDVVADGHPGPGRRHTVPDDLSELVVRGDLPGAQRQGRQDYPLLGGGDRYQLAAIADE